MNLKKIKSGIIVYMIVLVALYVIIPLEINTVKAPVTHANPPYGPGANTSSEDGLLGYDAGPPGDSEVVWSPMDNPHWIRDNYTVEPGWWLRILPGCEIRFDSGINLSVQGILEADGGDIGITFTSNQSVKSPGDWAGIIVDIGTLSIMNNCIVEYSTDGVYVTNMMGIGGGVHDSILRYNSNYGVYLRDVMGGPPVWNCDIYNNSYGVYSLSSTLQLGWNNIFNNTIGVLSGVWTFPVGPSINQNNITDNSLDGILTEGDSASIYENVISDNGRHGINATPSKIFGFPATPYIVDNNITNNSGCGIHTVDSRPIIGSWGTNNILNNSQHGIFIETTNGSMGGVEISYNNIQNNSDGIRIYDESPLIDNNYLAYNSYGINLIQSSNSTISNNTVTTNGFQGIHLEADSNNNTINNNTILYNSYGIRVEASSNNNITHNNIYSNINYGIHLPFMSSGNTMANNTVSNNDVGVDFDNFCISNVLVNNTIFKNDVGIIINDSPGNFIYHNNFIANTIQTLADSGINQWDNDYPSGGNYWSDFDEPSEGAYNDYQGPDQDIVGSDGIVDNGSIVGGGKNPYIINSNNQDNYPLITSEGNYLFLYEGWNLVSLPYIQSDEYLGTVLKSIKGSYDSVQWYNASDSSDQWKANSTSKPDSLNDLEDMGHTRGFWINIIEPKGVLFQYSGAQPSQNQTINLYEGWNMVGFPSLRNHNRTEGLNNLTFGKEIEIIQWYDAEMQTWYDMSMNDYFVIGRGYWIYARTECEWEVPL